MRCDNAGITHTHEQTLSQWQCAQSRLYASGIWASKNGHVYLGHVMLLSLQSLHGLNELLPLALGLCFNLAQLLPA